MHRTLCTTFQALAVLACVGQAHAGPTLCNGDEKVVFSCHTPKRTASVCASQDLSPTTGYMQYRFGRPGAVELELPQERVHPSVAVEGSAFNASGWASTGDLSFRNGPTSYSVHWSEYRSDRMAKNGTYPRESEAGIIVMRTERTVHLKCTLDVTPDPHYLMREVGLTEPK